LAQAHRTGTFPVDLIPELADLGVFGANIEGYGCAGLNNVAYGLMCQVRGSQGLLVISCLVDEMQICTEWKRQQCGHVFILGSK
jgi:hypothetical protein